MCDVIVIDLMRSGHGVSVGKCPNLRFVSLNLLSTSLDKCNTERIFRSTNKCLQLVQLCWRATVLALLLSNLIIFFKRRNEEKLEMSAGLIIDW